jgi:pyruvate,water dikinase
MSKASELNKLIKWGFKVSSFIKLDKAADLKTIYKKLSINKRYAVRSSANMEDSKKHSFAGIFDTYLNITYNDLPEAVSRVFDFSNNEKLKSYLTFLNMKISSLTMEVIIQEMVDCEKAGVAFSQNPVNNEPHIYIEALFGLGDFCVSGKSPCDKIQMGKNGKVISYEAGFQEKKSICCKKGGTRLKPLQLIDQSKKKLSIKELSIITDNMNRLSNHVNYPFEIEWGFSKDDFYIFQLRAITT